MQATTGALTVQIIKDRYFDKSVKAARRMGGSYNADSKTWSIPLSACETNSYGQPVTDLRKWLRGHGLELVSGCPHYTRDQGCPMHGETCAPTCSC